MTQCPQCGAQTTEGQPFCGTCGATLAPAGQAPGTPDEPATQIRGQQPTAQFPATPQQPQQPQQQAQQWGQQPQGQPSGQHPQQPQNPQGVQQYAAGQPQQQWGQQPPPAGGQTSGQQWGQQPPPPGQPGQQQWGQSGQHPQQGQWGQHPQQGGGPGGFDFGKLLVGNWAGMAMVALAAFGTALVLSLLWAFTTADKLDVGSALAATGLLTASTFGADMVQDTGSDTSLSMAQFPLLSTVLALGVATWLFRRTTAGYRDVKDALLDAVRAALILTVLITVVAIVMTIWEPKLKGYNGGENESEEFDFLGAPLGMADGKVTSSIAGAIFLTFIITAVVLLLSCLVRRDWLGDKILAKVHDFVAAPIIGFTTLIAATIPAGLLYLVSIVAGEKDARSFDNIMGLLANLPGIGLHMIGLGSLSKLGFHASSSQDDAEDFYADAIEDSGGEPTWVGSFAGDHGMIFWVALLVGIPALAAAVWMVVKRSTGKANPLFNVGVYIGSMLIVVPILVRLSNIHVKQSDDDESLTLTGGLAGGQTLLMFLLFSLVAAAAILIATGKLDVNALKAKAQTFQGQPGQGQWGQQPQQGHPQQQWGHQPPPQQGGQPPQQGQWGAPPQGQPPQGQPPQGQPPQQGQWGQQPPPQQGGQPPQQGGWGPPPQQ